MVKYLINTIFCIVMFMVCPVVGFGQMAKVGSKVGQVQIRDASNNPMYIPDLGKKVLLIFYIDPDRANQNKEFREDLEKHQINSSNIFSFGIINLKDAPMLPNAIVRSMIRSTAKRTGANIYTDPDHLLRNAWKLGDVDDKFTMIIVNKEKEIVYLSKGEITQAQIDEFNKVIDRYR